MAMQQVRSADRPAACSVGIVSNSEIMRFGIKGILRTIPDVGPVGDFACASVLRAEIEAFDVVMVCGGELEDVTRVATMAKVAGGKVLVLIEERSPEAIRGLLRLGADGYLLLPGLGASRLAAALAQLRDEQVPMSPEIVREILLRELSRPPVSRSGPANLTARERETLALLVEGLSNKQIARELGISIHGAKRLVANILIKLNCPTRTLAVRAALTLGLIAASQN